MKNRFLSFVSLLTLACFFALISAPPGYAFDEPISFQEVPGQSAIPAKPVAQVRIAVQQAAFKQQNITPVSSFVLGPTSPLSVPVVQPVTPATIPNVAYSLNFPSSLSIGGQDGIYEVTLNSDFDQLMSAVIPANLAKKFNSLGLVNVEFAVLQNDIAESLADLYDFIIGFPTIHALQEHFPYFVDLGIGIIGGMGSPANADIDGIGLDFKDPVLDKLNNTFGPLLEQNFSTFMRDIYESGPIEGSAMLDVQSIQNAIPGTDYLESILVHEIGHRWLVFMSSGGNTSSNPLGILGPDNLHWGSFFDANLSPMNGNDWQDNGDGTFTLLRYQGMDIDELVDFVLGYRSTLPVAYEFNDFELYALGLLPANQVQSSFVIGNPKLGGKRLTEDNFLDVLMGSSSFLFGNHTIQGVRRNVTVQDIINIEGPRDPSSADSQKDFTVAFGLIKDQTPDNSQVSTVQAGIDYLAGNIGSIWSQATRGLSTMSMGGAAGAFNDFVNRALQIFDDANNADPQDAIDFQDAINQGDSNIPILQNLEGLLQPVMAVLDPVLAKINSGIGLSGSIGTAINEILNIRDAVANARSQYDNALPEAKQILPDVLAIANAAQNGRDQLLAQLNQAAATGILPSGFGGFADSLIQSFQSPVQAQVGPLTQALQAANQSLQNPAAYTATLNQAAAFLQGIFIPPSAFNPAAISTFSGDPKLSIGGGATNAGQKPGIMDIVSHENSEITFSYDVGKSATAFAAGTVEFPNGPEALPENIVLSFKGPAGALLKVVFTDASGDQAEFFLELSPNFSNFNLSFSGSHIPAGFDRTQITKMEFMLDQVLAGTKNRRGTLAMRTNGNDFAAVYAGVRAVRYKTKTSATGQLTSFEERIYDSNGQFLYSLKCSGIRRDRNTGVITGYTDTYTMPDRSRVRGMYKSGLYTLSGTVYLGSVRQMILQPHALGPDERFVLDPALTASQKIGNVLLGGYGEASQVGNNTVVRYVTRLDRYGNETGFEEGVYDQSGNLLYALKRTGIRRDKTTGAIIAYSDTFKLPDKSSLRGMYKAGLYKFSGNVNLPSGKQKIQQYHQLGPNERFVLDPAQTSPQKTGNLLIGGFGELVDFGHIQVVRYYTTIDRYGYETGFEERVFDSSGNYFYAIKRTGGRRDRVTHQITGYTDRMTFPNRDSVMVKYSVKSGQSLLTVSGKLNGIKGAYSATGVLPDTRIGYDPLEPAFAAVYYQQNNTWLIEYYDFSGNFIRSEIVTS